MAGCEIEAVIARMMVIAIMVIQMGTVMVVMVVKLVRISVLVKL